VVLLTEWTEFREVDPEALGAVVAHRRVVDGRHALRRDDYVAAGWEYRALGRP
jgi:UDPglucose 6-dehydrogenase